MENSREMINVGISDFRIGSGDCILQTSGIGSCVAVVLYDSLKKIGGLSHSMLPGESESDPKYVGSAIEIMIKNMELLGADVQKLQAWIIGGADVLQESQNNSQEIGIQNIESALKKLKEKNIKVVCQDIGKNHSRSVEFDLNKGKITINHIKI
ncbi:MAG: chemotaxis protein CheD [Candidatus Parcubacteria bacterium]|nr:chemotaxis protein CheD [Candidatus Parcubacteria bacterium]